MRRQLMPFWCLILILAIPTSSLAQQAPWKKIRDKQGIEVFTRSNENSDFKEFMSKTVVQAEVDDFLEVLYDVESLPEWGYNLREATLIRRDADSLQVYYAVAKAPFPYKDRDGVYLNRFLWDAESATLTVEIRMLEGEIPEKADLVRMKGYGFWTVRELPDDRLEIHFQMQMDPGGNIPAWLSNMFSGDTPYYTMKGLRARLQDSRR